MIDKMYYDAFTEEYVLEPDPTAPPERYVETIRGGLGVYVDRWAGECDGQPGYALDIAYTTEEYYSDVHDLRYQEMCEAQNFKATRLICFVLPEEKFDEYVERFGLEQGGDDPN